MLPFLGKAPVVDEESYLFMANAIADHPLSPYDWWRNWQPWGAEAVGSSFHFAHPPLHLWWMCFWKALVGEGPQLRFLAAAPWVLLFGISAAKLAEHCTRNPRLALGLCLSSPVLLLGLHDGLMIDLGTLALSTASVALYRGALEKRGELNSQQVLYAGLLLGCAASYKYPALVLVPLFLLHLWRMGLLGKSSRLWLGFGGVFGALQLFLWATYGELHLLAALESATELDRSGILERGAGMLVRLGFAISPFVLLACASLRRLLLPGALLGTLCLLLLGRGDLGTGGTLFLLALASTGGALGLRAASSILPRTSPRRRQHDREDGLLLGGWAFLVLLSIVLAHNHADSRYLLPAILPLSLLLVRSGNKEPGAKQWIRLGAIAWAAMALVVALGDYRLAQATNALSVHIAKDTAPARFSAEWTARYRLEKEGWDFWHPTEDLAPGERVLILSNGGSASPPKDGLLLVEYASTGHFPVRTLDWRVDAGYHSEQLGRLPVAWGHGPLVKAQLYEMPQ
jgi:hypothetical protein